jgi:cell division protease FtsH
LGGRVAEEVVFGTITTGAESDMEHLTGVARQMVGRWGMSDDIGPVTLLPRDDGNRFPGVSDVSQETLTRIDQEVQRLVDDAHHAVTALLSEHREQLDNLAAALLAAETLDAPAAYAAAMVKQPFPPDESESLQKVGQ